MFADVAGILLLTVSQEEIQRNHHQGTTPQTQSRASPAHVNQGSSKPFSWLCLQNSNTIRAAAAMSINPNLVLHVFTGVRRTRAESAVRRWAGRQRGVPLCLCKSIMFANRGDRRWGRIFPSMVRGEQGGHGVEEQWKGYIARAERGSVQDQQAERRRQRQTCKRAAAKNTAKTYLQTCLRTKSEAGA